MEKQYLDYEGLSHTIDKIDQKLANKVDKITGKQLSSEDFTTVEKTKLAGIEAQAEVNAESIIYSALKSLYTNSQLVPGRKYRITDYVTTTAQNDTQSAGNIFDIIVTADSTNTLSENAEAIQHTVSSSDYFYGQKLGAWKLKYDIENDTQKYAWADSTNGKGVIYELEDEYGNKCGYDFKNIKMRFYQISSVKDSDYQDVYEHGLTDSYSISKSVGSTQYILNNRFNVGSNSEYRYTFDFYSGSTHYDYSLNKWNDNRVCCYGNIIKPLFGIFSNESLMGNTDTNGNKRYINFVSFRNSIGNTAYLYGNIFGERNFNMSFLGMCYRNVFGNNCNSNIFAEGAWNNHFGDKSMNNVVGTVVIDNIFDSICTSKAMYNVNGNHYSVAASGTLEAKRLVRTEELGTAASANVGDFATAAQGLKADAALLKTGGAMSGDVTTTVTSFTNNSLVTKNYIDSIVDSINWTGTQEEYEALTPDEKIYSFYNIVEEEEEENVQSLNLSPLNLSIQTVDEPEEVSEDADNDEYI